MRPCIAAKTLLLCLLAGVNNIMAQVVADSFASSHHQQQQQQRTLRASNINLETCTLKESFFDITLVNMGDENIDNRYKDAFESAVQRWSKVIVGDLQGFEAGQVEDWFGGIFAPNFYNGEVDDLVIGYQIGQIDGPGRTLGSAGPLFVRRSPISGRPLSTISGVMLFDIDDFDRMSTNDVKAIILHEMGHVFGLIGTTGLCNAACDASNPSEQATYTCPFANDEFSEWAPSDSLALENDGGMGTACGHWEEDLFRAEQSSELMTGFFEANLFQPLSRVTVAALADIGGYEIDFCGADIWPATEETQQRFEVHRMNTTMEVPDMMDPIFPGPDQFMPVTDKPTTPSFPTGSPPFPTLPPATSNGGGGDYEPTASSAFFPSVFFSALLFLATVLF